MLLLSLCILKNNIENDTEVHVLLSSGSSPKVGEQEAIHNVGDKSQYKQLCTSCVWNTFEDLPVGLDNIKKAECKKYGYECSSDTKNGTRNMLKHQKVVYKEGRVNVHSLS